jgi:hypothetical protein
MLNFLKINFQIPFYHFGQGSVLSSPEKKNHEMQKSRIVFFKLSFKIRRQFYNPGVKNR